MKHLLIGTVLLALSGCMTVTETLFDDWVYQQTNPKKGSLFDDSVVGGAVEDDLTNEDDNENDR